MTVKHYWDPCKLLKNIHLCINHFLNNFTDLFLAALGLRCYVRAFSSCGEWRLLCVAVHGLLFAAVSLALDTLASGVAACRLKSMDLVVVVLGLAAVRYVESSWTRG